MDSNIEGHVPRGSCCFDTNILYHYRHIEVLVIGMNMQEGILVPFPQYLDLISNLADEQR